MNIFRLIGDLLHLLSILILIQKIRSKKSCAGISLKSIELYELVFVTRYLDLFTEFVSLYNTLMKIFYIASTAAIIYLMRVQYRRSYDKAHDNAWLSIPIAFAVVMALIFTDSYEPLELLWTFSIFLEAVAMVPQLWMLWLIKEVETLTADYTATLGLYRAFYLLNWIYRYYDEGFLNWIVTAAGILQTLIYCDFLYYYVRGYVCISTELDARYPSTYETISLTDSLVHPSINAGEWLVPRSCYHRKPLFFQYGHSQGRIERHQYLPTTRSNYQQLASPISTTPYLPLYKTHPHPQLCPLEYASIIHPIRSYLAIL